MIYCIGECMIEFSKADGDMFRRSFAGDVYNTAVYATRFASKETGVEFVTAVGDDPVSAVMVTAWKEEGVGVSYVGVAQDRAPGLYLIDTDDAGERRFSYWRSHSAARRLRLGMEMIDPARLQEGDVIYYSGVTLAIVEPADRRALFNFIGAAREAGATVAFDPNYRPALWATREAAADAVLTAYARADIVFTGMDEETALFGQAAEGQRLDAIQEAGVREAILKTGARGVFGRTHDGAFHIPFIPADHVVDTTAAGDSFAGAYLAFRLRGAGAERAAALAARAARIVIAYPGAIIDQAAFAAQVERDSQLAAALAEPPGQTS